MITYVRLYMNITKTEAQAHNTAPRHEVSLPPGLEFDTHCPATGFPKDFHKHLGIFVFTNDHPQKHPAFAKR